MKLFFDTEFSSLSLKTDLISLAIVDEQGRAFYYENSDYCIDPKSDHYDALSYFDVAELASQFVRDNVLPTLSFNNQPRFDILKHLVKSVPHPVTDLTHIILDGSNDNKLQQILTDWLKPYHNEKIEMWGDVPAYDWVLFANIYGVATALPKNILYIPLDIATMAWSKGINPDIDRHVLGNVSPGPDHNALYDAWLVKKCFISMLEE